MISSKRRGCEGSKENVETVSKGLSCKALILGVMGILFLAWLESKANFYKEGVSFDLISAPSMGAMFLVLVLMMVNLLLRRLLGRNIITEGEMIIIYIMTSFAGIVVAYPYYISSLFPRLMAYAQMSLVFSKRYPDVAGRMSGLLVPEDMNAVNGFLRGDAPVPWELWLVPILMWWIFFIAFFLLQLSLAAIFRRRWTDVEHLSYPLTVPIYSIISEKGEGGSLWRDHLVWLGALIPLVVFTLASLNKYFPGVPEISLTRDLKEVFPEGPWKTGVSTNYLIANFNPLYMGIAYLLPLDLLFSFWFFFFVITLRNVVMATFLPGEIYRNWTGQPSEYIGGFAAIALVLIWTARHDLAYVIKRGISGYRDPDIVEENEPFSYRTAFWLFILSFAFLVYFYGVLLDGSIGYVVVVLFSFCGTALSWARVRAEAGLPQTQAGTWFNTVAVAQSTGRYRESILLVGLGHQVVDYGGMGCQAGVALEAYALGDKGHVSRKSVTAALLVSFLVAIGVFLPMALKAFYTKGAYVINKDLAGFSWYQYYQNDFTSNGTTPNSASYIMGALTFAITLFLYILRLRFVWWPFHPVGFAMPKHIYGPRYLWFPFLVMWILKFSIYRWAGTGAIRKFKGFALGLIVGSIITQAFWALVGLVL